MLLFRCLGILGKVITANQACLKWEATTEIPIVYQAIMAWIPLGEPSFSQTDNLKQLLFLFLVECYINSPQSKF